MTSFTQRICLFTIILRAALSASAEEKYDFIVAADGSGTHTTVQAAVNDVPDYRKSGPTRILIRRGTYHEKLVVPASKEYVWLVGEEGTVISYDDFAQKPNRFGENIGTSGSASAFIFGRNFHADNITFENASGPVGQAVACFVAADRAVFRHCRFLGHQDTLYTFDPNSRQYYEDCYIEGTVDFIFGKATAYFLRCQLHSLSNGYLTAPATPEGHRYGYVFRDCKMTAAEGIDKVYFSRPWRPCARCVFIHCDLGAHILPQGWHNWGNPANEKTVLYAEYDNYGPGADTARRASFGRQLTSDNGYDVATALAGDDGWNPTTNQ